MSLSRELLKVLFEFWLFTLSMVWEKALPAGRGRTQKPIKFFSMVWEKALPVGRGRTQKPIKYLSMVLEKALP